ncbi:hypothetical protein KUTeg_009757 [Tegillarca granosa]|uniref:Solute carrier family 43 member 3 n=1 Tax=Tegillarca granosa TaxID=220873 RepID=A0ABQ9F4U0_TEGGR|nr:hypothetical protein KUTeg_009757 [Tegillarca granosa]
MAKCECNKRHVSLVWALLECVFFTGLVFGWTWLSASLRRDGYFLDYCNVTFDINFDLTLDEGTLIPKPESPKELNPDLITNVENSRLQSNKQRKKKCRKKKISTTTKEPKENIAPWKTNDTQYFCDKQESQLELMNAIVLIIRNALILPIGFFLDSYGTTRTRLITFPWIIIPAFSLLSWAGLVILVTNLQVANLFGRVRCTILSSLIGCFHASSLVLHLVKLTQYDLEIQTSFMFLTIGVIPILVSTIAFLPKSRIPWPLPASYGKRGAMVKDSSNSRHSVKMIEKKKSEVFDIIVCKL